ncbi:MAG: hypothetical protein ACLQIK_08380 [Mycobacterium sp.]|uniref:hypothetical protein n=1 Tax=Mycobacterium sp. TaxID=1785 RepID=UPI003F9CD035
MTAVRFQHRGDGHAVTFAYDPTIVELLKAMVPSFVRSWNPQRREWMILEPVYATQFADTLRRLGHPVIGIDDPPAQRQHATDPAGWARAVFTRVGAGRAPLAYKLLSRLCHPDHGGDHQLQVELNQAFGELSERKKTA